ncbi:hypothetical protein PV10_08886 [Exophiala mesophila]|uniref:Uncharacterized protein n=1 Tax=Exophiala mesophila TaxID=212818 RepID=A0A0D1Z5Z1_EXOME|nr:uncharacterized protein PV10_08886 [Exophiala mesophila]KIV89309.1 hypothetical protein PV10_08886 [Exophiala mesophila]
MCPAFNRFNHVSFHFLTVSTLQEHEVAHAVHFAPICYAFDTPRSLTSVREVAGGRRSSGFEMVIDPSWSPSLRVESNFRGSPTKRPGRGRGRHRCACHFQQSRTGNHAAYDMYDTGWPRSPGSRPTEDRVWSYLGTEDYGEEHGHLSNWTPWTRLI